MVPGAGLEPALLSEEDFKSSVSAIPPPGLHLYKIVANSVIFKENFAIYQRFNKIEHIFK